MDPQGNHIGYMAEQELGMKNMMARQMLRTHRSFVTHIFDKNQVEVLRVSEVLYRLCCNCEHLCPAINFFYNISKRVG